MEKLSPEARRVLARGRSDAPTSADRERVRKKLAGSLAAGAALAAGWVTKAIAAVVVLAGGVALLGALPRPAPTPAPAAPAAAAALPPTLPREPAPPDALPEPAPLHRGAPVAPARVPHQEPKPAPAPVAPAPPPEDALVAETNALREAHAELQAGHAAQALQLLDEQLLRFRGGALEQERLAARILALCQLQQREAALEATATLERAYPGSPLLSHLRSACAAPAR